MLDWYEEVFFFVIAGTLWEMFSYWLLIFKICGKVEEKFNLGTLAISLKDM